MINIKEVSQKLEQVLNDNDNPLRIDNQRVLFAVATQGYRIDSIYNRQQGKNVIPVFVALNGGENNPIPNLKQTSNALQIAIYYPIKYKDLFYDLESYLANYFVGKMINFGTLTGSCLTNMGIAEYGEISQMNLQQFAEWVGNTYEKTFDITSNWFSMSFMLYATSLGSGFLYGNDVSYKMYLTYYDFTISTINVDSSGYKVFNRYSSGDITQSGLYCWKTNDNNYIFTKINPSGLISNKIKYLNGIIDTFDSAGTKTGSYDSCEIQKVIPEQRDSISADLVWSNTGTGASISPISQQLIDVNGYAKNVSNITNYNKSMVVYPQSNNFWDMFFALYNTQRLEYIANIQLNKNYSNGFKYVYDQLTLNINENIELGQPLSFTITLGDRNNG